MTNYGIHPTKKIKNRFEGVATTAFCIKINPKKGVVMRVRIFAIFILVCFFAIGVLINTGSCADVKKKGDSINDYFSIDPKPSKEDIECFNICKKNGHTCGYYRGGKPRAVGFKKNLKMRGVVEKCQCFDQ
jgi:hypothetical protein